MPPSGLSESEGRGVTGPLAGWSRKLLAISRGL